MKARITFLDEVLGTTSGDKEIATEHILSNHPEGIQSDEVDALPDVEEVLEKKFPGLTDAD